MTSIRRRLLVWLAGGLLLLFTVAGVAIYQAVRDRVRADLVEDTTALAGTIAAGLQLTIDPTQQREVLRLGALALEDPRRPKATWEDARRRLRLLAPTAFHIQLALPAGALPRPATDADAPRLVVYEATTLKIIANNTPAKGSPPLTRSLAPGFRFDNDADGAEQLTCVHEVPDVRFADGGWDTTWRELRGTDPTHRRTAHVWLRRSTSGVERFLGRVKWGLILGGLGLGVLIALVSWLVVRRGLAPLAALGAQVGQLDAATLGQRVAEAGLPRELHPIAHQLNGALERIEASVDRERRTAGHIAHELRTPIAELQSITEIARRWPDDLALQARAVADSHDVALHMARVVSALLKVARAGSGAGAVVFETIDLVPVLARAFEGCKATAAERQQELDAGIGETLLVETDPDIAEAVLASLLKNAIQHAPVGSRISVRAEGNAPTPTLTIQNPAPDLTAADMAHVAEAFWRKDAARTHSEEAGLGLTLAFELCRSARIEVEPRLAAGQFSLTLTFASATEDCGLISEA